jgi:serine/threonine protein kinase
MAIEGIPQSKEKIEDNDDISVICREDCALKIYPFSVFVKNQSKQMEFFNEYTIMTEASKGNFLKVIHLSGCELGSDHILLRMPRYPLSFREYLWRHRDANQLRTLMIDIALGLKELHELGYVHRDLKPENVMVSLKPVKATLIDFNRAYPLT